MADLKPWCFYKSPLGYYYIMIPNIKIFNTKIMRLSSPNGIVLHDWNLDDFIKDYNAASLVEINNPYEGIKNELDS